MCMELYTGAAYACEQSMEYFSQYNGQNVENCEYVEDSLPKAVKKSMRGGAVFGWIIFALLVVGVACYVVWWRNSKLSTRPNLMDRNSKRKWYMFWKGQDLADAVSPHYNAAATLS